MRQGGAILPAEAYRAAHVLSLMRQLPSPYFRPCVPRKQVRAGRMTAPPIAQFAGKHSIQGLDCMCKSSGNPNAGGTAVSGLL